MFLNILIFLIFKNIEKIKYQIFFFSCCKLWNLKIDVGVQIASLRYALWNIKRSKEAGHNQYPQRPQEPTPKPLSPAPLKGIIEFNLTF